MKPLTTSVIIDGPMTALVLFGDNSYNAIDVCVNTINKHGQHHAVYDPKYIDADVLTLSNGVVKEQELIKINAMGDLSLYRNDSPGIFLATVSNRIETVEHDSPASVAQMFIDAKHNFSDVINAKLKELAKTWETFTVLPTNDGTNDVLIAITNRESMSRLSSITDRIVATGATVAEFDPATFGMKVFRYVSSEDRVYDIEQCLVQSKTRTMTCDGIDVAASLTKHEALLANPKIDSLSFLRERIDTKTVFSSDANSELVKAVLTHHI